MQTLKYIIGLCNVFWNRDGIDTRYFESVASQRAYFLFKVGAVNAIGPRINFNINDNISTTITYIDDSNRSIEELIACNYAVLFRSNPETNEVVDIRYYYAKVSQLSGRQMRVELDLDDIQTNYFKYKNQIAPCVINRAHLNRFVKNEDNTFSFDFRSQSHLFDLENYPTSKRLVNRRKLVEKIFNADKTENETLTQWFNENVIAWVYCYIENRAYNCFKPDDLTQSTCIEPDINYFFNNQIENEQGIQTAGCIIYPLLKENSKVIFVNDITNNNKWQLVKNDDKFRELNNDTSFYYIKKVSILNPLQFVFTNNNWRIDDNGNLEIDTRQPQLLQNNNYLYMQTGEVTTSSSTQNFICLSPGVSVMLYGARNYNLPREFEYINEDIKFTFNKSDLINGERNKIYNPKLLTEDFITLNITSGDGSTFKYPINALNNNKLTILYNETLTPEVTKYFARVKTTGLFIKETEENYTGLIGNVDNSLLYTNDRYQEFLANNKNFWLQSTFNSLSNIGRGAIAGAISGAGPVGAVIGGTLGAIQSTANKVLDIDNLKYSPEQIKGASGNVLFNADVSGIGIFVDIFESLEHDKQKFDDFIYLNGFSYGEIGSVADFDNIRTKFNYLSADVEIITANISNEEKTRLIERLKSVRFWNSDDIDYINENYERSVLNG